MKEGRKFLKRRLGVFEPSLRGGCDKGELMVVQGKVSKIRDSIVKRGPFVTLCSRPRILLAHLLSDDGLFSH
jgi:hypothetical protein